MIGQDDLGGVASGVDAKLTEASFFRNTSTTGHRGTAIYFSFADLFHSVPF